MFACKTRNYNSESGNVLFLILIAVALFAALSYAVTQSTRTGGGSGDNETALISSAQLTQYPASIRTSVVRMIIGGTDVTNLEFNSPSQFGTLVNPANGVFHPSGGGATYANAPGNMMATGSQGAWVFNGENQIDLLGTTDAGGPITSTADIIAFLPGITLTLCQRINTELGLAATPVVSGGLDITTDMIDGAGITAGGGTIGDPAPATDAALDGQPFGCLQHDADLDGDGTNDYVYYHVLVER